MLLRRDSVGSGEQAHDRAARLQERNRKVVLKRGTILAPFIRMLLQKLCKPEISYETVKLFHDVQLVKKKQAAADSKDPIFKNPNRESVRQSCK
jgi:hypothetical protein